MRNAALFNSWLWQGAVSERYSQHQIHDLKLTGCQAGMLALRSFEVEKIAIEQLSHFVDNFDDRHCSYRSQSDGLRSS